MPQNGFSVGRDVSLTIITPTGNMDLGLIISFESKPDIIDQKIKGLDGITRHVRFMNGWSGTFMIERQDSMLDDYWAQLEANYYAGIPELPSFFTETITEPSGAVTQWRYIGVLLTMEDHGTWQGDQTVKQKMSYVAQQRVRV